MNIGPPFTNIRAFVADEFCVLRMNALYYACWAALTGRRSRLLRFPQGQSNHLNKILLGAQDICVTNIIGTLNREKDFDPDFRPLKMHLRDGWIRARLEQNHWLPIVAHKVGKHYYIEDGHHRVSVAQFTGMLSIPAKVWEYSCRCTG